MTRRQKLYQRLISNQKNVKFTDLVTVVESFGFVLDRIKGSHRIYKHPAVLSEFLTLQPDRNGQAKPYQIKQFLSLVEEYNLNMGGTEDKNGDNQ